jgi:serine phosphatase RsbU (regulator of sigma subunit)
MPKILPKIIIILVGAIVLVLMLLVMALQTSMVANWTGSGFTMCSIQQVNDSTLTFFGVDSADFVAPPYPTPKDTILTIADSAASEKRWITMLEVRHTPGRQVKITYLDKGAVREATLRTRAVEFPLKLSVLVLQVVNVLVLLSFLALGFWAFFKRPESPAVRALALYCFAMVTFMARIPLPMYREMASFQLPFDMGIRYILAYIGVFFSSFWLLLNLHFPRPSRLIIKYPVLAYGMAFAPQIALIAVRFIAPTLARNDAIWGRYIVFPIVAAQVLCGLYLLWRHFRQAKDNIEKRQTRLVLGSGLALIIFLMYAFNPFGIRSFVTGTSVLGIQIATVVVGLFLLMSPFTLAYAIGKYRLLELEARLRRGTRSLIVLGVLIAVLVGLGYLVSGWVNKYFEQGSFLSVSVTAATVLVILLGAQKTEKIVERRVFPERERLRHLIHDFLQRTVTLADKQSFWQQLEERLRDGLMVDGVYPLMRKNNNGDFLLRDKDETPFRMNSGLVRELETHRRPLMVDELVCCSDVEVSPDELAWLSQNNVALLLPMIAHGALVGFLGLGTKIQREDYAAEELRILDSLAPQVALASDNMRLLEENIGKQRLEEELAIARHVQEGFLPREIPQVHGLEIAAHMIFCYEIAGDYYDVIALEDGRTVLAIGDVSGKGAGAALIMANLQASMRALCGVGLALPEVMGRINRLIHQNTEPEQFITFFVGVFEPRRRTLTYVNAGHNPPLMVHENRQNRNLETGGLILGVFPEATYEQEILQLSPGDVLFLYTDGVSEAMNVAGEELGEHRLREMLLASAKETPHAIVENVLEMVNRHTCDLPTCDDLTLLVAKVV